ncbi:MAG: carbohydrate binding family 9 domain-containing protein [Gemmatimonadales bacterium]|nr:carbohydrate binding family 9 domain-containing protein [Gemmatimonadales bacterium]
MTRRRVFPTLAKWVAAANLIGLLGGAGLASAQEPSLGVPGMSLKRAVAVAVPPGSIRVDGRLDEVFWAQIPPVADFTQKEPVEGADPTERTEVRFAFDDEALYVGARMFSSGGRAAIQAPLGRRDAGDLAEYLLVSLDTHLDRRTAYSFGVTAAGVRLDHFHGSDSESEVDRGFDPVWRASVTTDDTGWTAEMWIPLSQLRYSALGEQAWGLNMERSIPSKNESDYWIAVPRTERAWASRFGELRGVRTEDLGRRVELRPYATAGSSRNGDRDRANPFDDGVNLRGRVGLDLKMGVGPNLTLDATITPDFGQVEADPAVVNLTDAETLLPERRPFFTEGNALINGPVNNYFYSRRIGAAPPGSAQGDFVDRPNTSTIIGAAKVTGRLPSGTLIGVLAAVTGQESAKTYDVGSQAFDEVVVAPRTAYGSARVQQEFGPDGSSAGVMVTGVHRDLAADDPLASSLVHNAVTVNGNTFLRLADATHELSISGGLTYVGGEKEAITRLQRNSSRYFQRPDATHVRVDPERTSMVGAKATVQAEKISGRHWLWNITADLESPEGEFNNLGRLVTGDGLQLRPSITYRELTPGRLFRNYRFDFSDTSEWNFAYEHQSTFLAPSASFTWTNFWTTRLSARFSLPAQSQRLTRGGPSMGTPFGWTSSLNLGNRASSQTRWTLKLDYGRDDLGRRTEGVNGRVSMVPSPRWQVSLSPSYDHEINPRQYVSVRGGGGPATYGSRYLFAFTDRTTFAMETRLSFTLKPDVNLELYAQPFAASGRYYNFGELEAAGSRFLRTYGTDGTTISAPGTGARTVVDGADSFVIPNRDFNVKSFRSTMVLQWEWRPGSTLYLVWQQDRSDTEAIGNRVGLDDPFRALSATGSNYFAIKASYWLGGLVGG